MKKSAAILLMTMFCLCAVCAQALTITGLETETVTRDWAEHKFFSRMETLTGISAQAKAVTDTAEYAKLLSAMAHGEVGADMQVESANDGPVTLILDTEQLMETPRHK